MPENDAYVAPGSDVLAWACPSGHEVRVAEYVWTRFDRHGCGACGKTYTRAELRAATEAT